MRVCETEKTARNDGNEVIAIRDAREFGHFLVEEGDKVVIPYPRRAVGDSSDICLGKVESHEQSIKFRKCTAQRMSNLR